MAGWSVIADGSVVDCETRKKKKEEPDCFSEASKRSVSGLPDKLRSWFDQFLGVFLKEICTRDSLRPLPPMLGNGQRVDLFKLFWAVRKKGGFDCVSDSGVWDFVAGECGLGLSLGGAVKLVYTKYLYLLERLLENKDLEWSLGSSGVDLGKQLMDLQDEFTGLFPEVADRKVKDRAEYLNAEMSPKSLKDSNEVAGVGEKCGGMKKSVDNVGLEWDSGTVEKVSNNVAGNVDVMNSMEDAGKLSNNEEVKSEVVESGAGKKLDDDDDDYIDVMIVNPATMEVSSCRKRKRESFCGMLNWIRKIAADPCDPSVASLPERSKWKSFGKEENWKRVLGAREAMFLKRNADSVAEPFNFQNNLRIMHPSMYDDHLGSSYNLRERQRLEKQLRTMSESGACSFSSPASDMSKSSPGMEDHIEVRVGSKYQAHVAEWTGESSESESKWLGTRDWPIENPEHRNLIERDPLGKGRQESCGCQMPGSIECVRFHIAEKRLRVKRELGSAFYHWKFNQMGEEVGLPWPTEEEKKFKAIIKANPPSLGKTFWDDIIESFPKKSWRELVSFYFNVYILQRRGYQNRFTPNNIDSDDEDLESGTAINGFGQEEPNSSKSILKSPHKPHGKYR
ncbi:AT-rich interactive domain-containing protein 1 [Rosa rugosa]|uniref:AT-rich interactive domain-containing protein 1 n=1 Tax=Rosa rugosa TaxID=74645 RepID=UPI002B40DC5C|nr:AT-rich interactive domain-containing protein 1 [Rosa rugosa]XP_062000090.1 AT-rich interactive domain-containing protein 1 [Rosa rugosa]